MKPTEDLKEASEMYTTIAIKGSEELRRSMGLREDDFRFCSPSLWANPRPDFVFRCLDEVLKAGVELKDWSTKLPPEEMKSKPSHFDRIVTQWLEDEQSFRMRKLIEILVDLICFSSTNEPRY